MTESLDTIDVVVKRITHEATGIASFELRPAEGGTLPPFTAGAHIDIRLGNGMVRSYSLVNPQGQSDRYEIAVNLDRSQIGRANVRTPVTNAHLVSPLLLETQKY